MDIEKVKQVIKDVIDEKLAATERDSARAELESVLSDTASKIEELNLALSTKLEEISCMMGELDTARTESEGKSSRIVELEEEVANLKSTVETKDKDLESVTSELASIKEVVEKAEKDKKLVIRLKELADLNVLRSGEKLEVQKEKVSLLTDEEFDSYKEDLVSLRKEFSTSFSTDNVVDKSVASLNIEGGVVEDTLSDYEKLGQALAENAKSRLRR